MAKESTFAKFGGLCIIVEDLEKSVEAYTKQFGLGPWRRMTDVLSLKERRVNGVRQEGIKHATKICRWGDMILQICQPLEGPSVEVEWLKTHGPGLMHFDFCVEDMDAAKAEAKEKGFEIIAEGEVESVGTNPPNEGAFAFLQSKEINDIAPYFELIKWAKGSGNEDLNR